MPCILLENLQTYPILVQSNQSKMLMYSILVWNSIALIWLFHFRLLVTLWHWISMTYMLFLKVSIEVLVILALLLKIGRLLQILGFYLGLLTWLRSNYLNNGLPDALFLCWAAKMQISKTSSQEWVFEPNQPMWFSYNFIDFRIIEIQRSF